MTRPNSHSFHWLFCSESSTGHSLAPGRGYWEPTTQPLPCQVSRVCVQVPTGPIPLGGHPSRAPRAPPDSTHAVLTGPHSGRHQADSGGYGEATGRPCQVKLRGPLRDAAGWAQRPGVASSLGHAAPAPPPAICIPEVLCGKNVTPPDPGTSRWCEFCHRFLSEQRSYTSTRQPQTVNQPPRTPTPSPMVASPWLSSLKVS